MKDVFISPSILSADFTKMGTAVKTIEDYSDYIHCDVMDGLFVPNISFGPKMVKDIRKICTAPLDVHLMIVEPERYVQTFIESGADILTFHIEATKKPADVLESIKARNIKSGLAISPDTEIDTVRKFLHLCDVVVLMSVYPGFGGQKFLEKSIERLDRLTELRNKVNPDALIEIDGGINLSNYEEVIAHGADILVAGSAVLNAEDPISVIKEIKKIQ